MYYEEKIINGVLMCRTRPNGDWQQCSIEKMGRKIDQQAARIAELEKLGGELAYYCNELERKGELKLKNRSPEALTDLMARYKHAVANTTPATQGDEVERPNFEAFADTMITAAWEAGSFDGADIQEIAEECGLLKPVTATEACGEHCGCAEHGFPLTCYRKTYTTPPQQERG